MMACDTIGAAIRIWRKSNAYGFYYCNQLFKILKSLYRKVLALGVMQSLPLNLVC
jgi:hypothetical protein